MSIYGDLSKAQRALLQDLFHGSSDLDQVERAVLAGPGRKSRRPAAATKTAVSIDTAYRVVGKAAQTAENLRARGFVDTDRYTWRPRVWLTEAGLDLMRSLDYRHARRRI